MGMIDEIVKELEEKKYNDILIEHKRYNHAIDDAIEIVKKYDNDGWIDVNDRLPSERDWYLAVFKEIDTEHILIPRVADFIGIETPVTTSDNWMIIDFDQPIEYLRILKCVAWKPLPQPYKKEN